MGTMLIGHLQCACRPGDGDANLETVVRGLEEAERLGLQIVSFPEAFLTGYFKSEENARANCFAIDSPRMDRLLVSTAKFSPLFLVGFNELRDGRLFNTVAVVEAGNLLGTYSKAFPIYNYFLVVLNAHTGYEIGASPLSAPDRLLAEAHDAQSHGVRQTAEWDAVDHRWLLAFGSGAR